MKRHPSQIDCTYSNEAIVIKIICDYYQTSLDEINETAKMKRRSIAEPRQMLHYFLRKYTRMAAADIGSKVGFKDHATVLHSSRTIKGLCETNRPYRSKVHYLSGLIEMQQDLVLAHVRDEEIQ